MTHDNEKALRPLANSAMTVFNGACNGARQQDTSDPAGRRRQQELRLSALEAGKNLVMLSAKIDIHPAALTMLHRLATEILDEGQAILDSNRNIWGLFRNERDDPQGYRAVTERVNKAVEVLALMQS